MKIGTKKLMYVLDGVYDLNKISILQGDSAIGKTHFADICYLTEQRNQGYFTTGEIPIHVLRGDTVINCNFDISNLKNTLIIVDEDSPFLSQDTGALQNLIYTSTNKYMIITREKKFKFLSIPIEAVYTIIHQNRYNFITKKYSNLRTLIEPTRFDVIMTEDRKSSYLFFSDYFKGFNYILDSAKGKDNVCNKVKELIKNNPSKNLLIVVDACAFGLMCEQLKYILDNCPTAYLLTWKCFEEYLLRSRNFKDVDISGLVKESDYDKLLSSLIHYKKDHLTHCITSKDVCPKCTSVRECPYSVDIPRRKNYIHDELELIELEPNKPKEDIEAPNWDS